MTKITDEPIEANYFRMSLEAWKKVRASTPEGRKELELERVNAALRLKWPAMIRWINDEWIRELNRNYRADLIAGRAI